jgi:hypothetical protein
LRKSLLTQVPHDPFSEAPVSAAAAIGPGKTTLMTTRPDHGEDSYRGCDCLRGKKVLLTGGDSGIGRAVALAFAREGADLLIAYPNEDDDARETERLVQEADRQCVLAPGDIADPGHCRKLVEKAVSLFGRIDVLVNNTAHQMSFNSLDEISEEEWDRTLAVNTSAMFYLTKEVLPHMQPGSAIINTASINADASADLSAAARSLDHNNRSRKLGVLQRFSQNV